MADNVVPLYPAAIVATSIEAGEEYAKALGIENYRVVTKLERAEGMRPRAIVVTPGYLEKAWEAYSDAMRTYDVVYQGFVMMGVSQG